MPSRLLYPSTLPPLPHPHFLPLSPADAPTSLLSYQIPTVPKSTSRATRQLRPPPSSVPRPPPHLTAGRPTAAAIGTRFSNDDDAGGAVVTDQRGEEEVDRDPALNSPSRKLQNHSASVCFVNCEGSSYATMNKQSYGLGSPKAFGAYPKVDFDIESGNPRKGRRHRGSVSAMLRALRSRISYFYKLHPVAVFLISLSLGMTILVLISVSESRFKLMSSVKSYNLPSASYPLPNLRNLVMVAGHSIYTSNSCGKVDSEGSWLLQSYQKSPGQAATFVAHIKEGIDIAAKDVDALLLFSGGETRKDAGPRSEAQSYWSVAESKDWFGKGNIVRNRALTEEHARDSFENLLFSVCRFRELTGLYPHNITVVSYDFKKERFTHLHRSAIGFPENRFFYSGTPVSASSRDAALKGEAAVRAQFQEDPYGCSSSLYRKKLGRDPFHRTIPYPNGCPELKGLFDYCGSNPYPGSLPWKA